MPSFIHDLSCELNSFLSLVAVDLHMIVLMDHDRYWYFYQPGSFQTFFSRSIREALYRRTSTFHLMTRVSLREMIMVS